MKVFLPVWKVYSFILISAIIISCGGSDIPEDIVENYVSGNTKISARYLADSNVIEKHFFSEGGELIHLEHDSLQYSKNLRNYLLGHWIMEKMVVNDETVFEIERYHATIMLTAINGFSELYTEDTLKAFELLKIQKRVLLPLLEEHEGTSLLDIMDDKLILIFEDSESAVECGIAIQETCKEIENLNHKIGIHVGEVMKKEDEVFGHDMNISSGMKYISMVGGIVISNKVNRSIMENEEIETKPLGVRYYKSKVGLDQAVKPYCIISHELPEPTNMADEIFFPEYKKSVLELAIPPNLYKFSKKELTISGPQYSADYNINFLDSSQVDMQGKWTYGTEGEDNYRTKRRYNKYYFQAISYNNFQWTDFLEDSEKEEEVLFYRVILPESEEIVDTSLATQEEPLLTP